MNNMNPITSNPRYQANDHAAELMAQLPENYIRTFRISQSEVVTDGINIMGASTDVARGSAISLRASSRTIVTINYDDNNPIWIKSVEICEIGKCTIFMDILTSGSVPILSCVIW